MCVKTAWSLNCIELSCLSRLWLHASKQFNWQNAISKTIAIIGQQIKVFFASSTLSASVKTSCSRVCTFQYCKTFSEVHNKF